ncbi:transposase [Wolbachia endosymbiont of Litomosoides brasiliensis]|uniref:transposase n=1 Tax=Wolbachia endosymbiont of Litomosoides brasiliensis TaxID=1812117 RepID=UPI00158B2012
MDYARRHKSKNLKVPKNIKTIYLPPYSLEFNPIERLCLYIKQNVLRNKVYNAVALLESALANLLPFFPTL